VGLVLYLNACGALFLIAHPPRCAVGVSGLHWGAGHSSLLESPAECFKERRRVGR
jgi:hypothetical protein